MTKTKRETPPIRVTLTETTTDTSGYPLLTFNTPIGTMHVTFIDADQANVRAWRETPLRIHGVPIAGQCKIRRDARPGQAHWARNGEPWTAIDYNSQYWRRTDQTLGDTPSFAALDRIRETMRACVAEGLRIPHILQLAVLADLKDDAARKLDAFEKARTAMYTAKHAADEAEARVIEARNALLASQTSEEVAR